MNDFMYEIMDLLEQGSTVVAKKGDKADPEELAMAVLQYCEAAGYTLKEVEDVDNGICRGIRKMFDRCRDLKFSGAATDELPL